MQSQKFIEEFFVKCFVFWILFFVLFRISVSDDSLSFLGLKCWTMKCIRFSCILNLIFNFKKSRICLFNSREAIAAIIGDIVVFLNSSSPSMILTTWRFLGINLLELTSVTSIALQLKFVYVTSFLLLGQLRDLPHSKKWLLNSLMEL